MTEQSHVPIEDKFKTAIRAVEPNSRFSDSLWRQLSQKQADKSQTSPARARFFQLLRVAVLALAVIALVIVIIGPQKVVNAFNSLFGYVPDVGLVDTSSPFRQLAKPVSDTRDGITLTVQSAFLSANQTIITYVMSDLPAEMKRARFGDPECFTPAYLILPDGSRFEASGSSGSLAPYGSFIHVIRFSNSVPANFNRATLVFPCLEDSARDKGPTDWHIALAFRPATESIVVYGVTLIPIQTGTVDPTAQPKTETEAPAMPAIIADGNRQETMVVLSVVEKPESYWVTWAYPDKNDNLVQIDGYLYIVPFNPVLYDANGVELPEPDSETQLELWKYEESLRNQLSDQDQMKYSGSMHTFVVPKSGVVFPVYAKQNVYERSFPEKEAYTEIEFDGSKVQTSNKPVEIDQEIQIGSVKFKLNVIEKDQFGGYSFLFDGTEGKVIQCLVELVGHPTNMHGDASFNLDDPFHFYQAAMFRQIPTGKLTVRVSHPAVLGDLISFIGSWSPEK
jgi:hypothetical protein